MTLEEIKANAPEGATHYRLRRNDRAIGYYVKHMNLHFLHGAWQKADFPLDEVKTLKPL